MVEILNNKAALFVFALRLWSIFSGGVSLFAVATALSVNEQGFYFTFNSIIMLQIFFELGLGNVIVQVSAHEILYPGRERFLLNLEDIFSGSRIQSLKMLLRRWYNLLAIIFTITTLMIGVYLFSAQRPVGVSWFLPWLFLVPCVGINLSLGWRLSFFEGLGFVEEVNLIRLLQAFLGSGLFLICIYKGLSLFSLVFPPLISSIVLIIWSNKFKPNLDLRQFQLTIFSDQSHINSFSWAEDIFPFQWRIALSWISGFFIFYLFNPLIFSYYGPSDAGKIGFALALYNSVTSLSSAFTTSRVPAIANHISLGNRQLAYKLYLKSSQLGKYISSFSAIFITIVIIALKLVAVDYGGKFPSIYLCLVVAFASIGNAYIYNASLLLRAQKKEPLLKQSVLSAILILILSFSTVRFGAIYPFISYCFVVWFIGVPWTALLVRRFSTTFVIAD